MASTAVPLGHKFTAVLLAAAVGGGVYAWLRYHSMQTASTAELSFDMHAARRVDPGFIQAHDPAVAFAQSVLTDQRLAALTKDAYLSTSGMMSRVGEFRSRLELSQPSGQTLDVRFRDADPDKAVDAANAIANALASWTPSPDGPAAITEPTAGGSTQPASAQAPAVKTQPAAPAHAAAPAPNPVVRHENPAAGSLASGLGALQAQLSSTNTRLDEIEHGQGTRGRAYAKSEEQQVLRSQVGAAVQKADELRSQATGSDRERMGEIHEALVSVLSGHSVGVSASEVRRERDALARAIAVVGQQRQEVEKEASASDVASSPAEDAAPPAPAAAPAAPASSGTGTGAISESNLSANGTTTPASSDDAAQSPPPAGGADAAMLDPLHVEKLAGAAGPLVWWPAAAAGVLCGLLYWMIAALRQPKYDDYETVVDSGPSYGRFITPDEPSAPAPPPPPPVVETAPVAGPVGLFERGSQRRASFTYEPTPEERRAAAEGRHGEPGRAVADPEAAAVEAQGATVVEEEKVVEIDPWADLMEKALSQTEIGRKLQSPADEARSKEADAQRARTNRLAG